MTNKQKARYYQRKRDSICKQTGNMAERSRYNFLVNMYKDKKEETQ